jgi:hypothetical protein
MGTSMSKALGVTLARAALAALVLTPAVGWAQQQPVRQKRNSQNAQNGVSTNISIVPNALSSPLLRNPEGLTPILSLGPLPRNNASPQFESDTAYINTQITQQVVQLTNQYLNMQENMAGGNGPQGSSQTGNGSSIIGNSNTVNGKERSKNARGLAPQKQTKKMQEGTGEHSNPGQGEGQEP